MRLRGIFVLALAMLPFAFEIDRSRAAEDVSTLVSGLQRLQDKIATGDAAAQKAHPAALKAIAERIEAADPAIWKDPRERNAILIYLLSGGAIGPVVRGLEASGLTEEESLALNAGIAYAAGRRRQAHELLSKLEPRNLDTRIAGQVAYARGEAALTTKKEPAVPLFDLARLLAPGSLVEEAALRREVNLSGADGDFPRFSALSRQYVRRFSRSLFYEGFKQNLFANVERFGFRKEDQDAQRYTTFAAALPPSDRRAALLLVARANLINGRAQIATDISKAALQDAPVGGADWARAKLYADAGRLLSGESEQAKKDLESLTTVGLERRDLALLAAARLVARALSQTTPVATEEKADGEKSADLPSNATISAAEAALARADALMAGERLPPP